MEEIDELNYEEKKELNKWLNQKIIQELHDKSNKIHLEMIKTIR